MSFVCETDIAIKSLPQQQRHNSHLDSVGEFLQLLRSRESSTQYILFKIASVEQVLVTVLRAILHKKQ